MSCPCRYCVPPKRHEACHDSCEDFAKWRVLKAEEKASLKALGSSTRHIGVRRAPKPHNRIGVWKKTNSTD